MPKVVIVSPSVRKGRNSNRIALYFEEFIKEHKLAEIEILDLLKYNFPIFTERLKYLDPQPSEALDFAKKIMAADGVIIITPEYNGAPPASLKNAVDLLTDEWYRKPVAFVTVSDGNFAGTQSIISLQFSLFKLGAITVPSLMRLPQIQNTFDENGIPENKQVIDKRASSFIDNLLWFIEARKKMSE